MKKAMALAAGMTLALSLATAQAADTVTIQLNWACATHFSWIVTVSAACAVAHDSPIVRPAASATAFFILCSELCEPAESGPIG